jgi:predicted XRE-type DNA-binding protein
MSIFLPNWDLQKRKRRVKHDAECEVEQLILLKQQLMQEISGWIHENHLKQAEAAVKLNISGPVFQMLLIRKPTNLPLMRWS